MDEKKKVFFFIYVFFNSVISSVNWIFGPKKLFFWSGKKKLLGQGKKKFFSDKKKFFSDPKFNLQKKLPLLKKTLNGEKKN